MKAVLFRQHGGPEVLEYADFPTPEPKPGEALIRLRAASLNRMDVMVRNGWAGLKLELPHINGADGAGEIQEIRELENRGLETRELETGDSVVINANLGCGQCEFCLDGKDNMCLSWHLLGETIRGTYAEFVCVPIKQLYKLPKGFDFHQAVASALVYQTAWHSLVTRGKIQRDETVLIVGAGGGVNTASIQIAKYLGARVIVVGSNAKKLGMAETIGADVLIDRSKEANWSKAVFLATNKRGVDAVVDNVGTTFMMSLRALRKGGRLLTVGNSGSPKFEIRPLAKVIFATENTEKKSASQRSLWTLWLSKRHLCKRSIDNRYMFAKHLSILGSTMSTLAEFKEVMDLVVAGTLKPVMDKTFPLQDAALAQERLWKNENFGKITLDISPLPLGEG